MVAYYLSGTEVVSASLWINVVNRCKTVRIMQYTFLKKCNLQNDVRGQ